MANNWSIDPKTTGSINDGGSKLPIGKTTHTIVAITRPVNKQDLTGKEQQVLIETSSNGATYKIYLNPESSNDQVSNIAKRTLVAFWDAAGQKDAIKPERLKKLEGAVVVLEVEETEGKAGTKNAGKKFTNIRSVTPGVLDEKETEGETTDEEENQEEEQQEDASPPTTEKRETPWEKAKRLKAEANK